ncbi:MAG: hypothetical protein VKK59_05975 [Vampirovibrionales bacterium]|nr:hypothetical protein [Vampirovibrionales bacterium]
MISPLSSGVARSRQLFIGLMISAMVGIGLSSIEEVQAHESKNINTDPPRNGHITLKTVGAGTLSLLIWPGIGQAVNDAKGEKVLTHALVGLFPPFRFWSGYDALYDRHGGYWDGKI